MNQIYDLIGCTGVLPVIAHLERYINLQHPKRIRELLDMEFPIQIGTDILLHPLIRARAIGMLRRGQAHLLASDCHNTVQRMPNWEKALDVVRRKLGDLRAEELLRCAGELVEG